MHATDLLNDPPVSPADLATRWTERHMPAHRRTTAADLRLVRTYLQQWADVIDASDEHQRVALLNELLRRYTAAPSITDHDGSGWHLHYRDPAAGFGAMLAGATSAAAAQYLTERGMHRLGRCALTECRRAFVDVSRPGRQKYCGHDCANRDAVRRHRRAKAANGTA